MEQNAINDLSGISDLFGKTWAIYKKRILTYICLLIAVGLLFAIPFTLLVGLGFLLSRLIPSLTGVLIAVTALLAFVISTLALSWGMTALFIAITDKECGIRRAFQQAKPKTLSFLWVYSLLTLILIGAFILFFVPGVIFLVWFYFALFILVCEDIHGMDALLKSKEYVKGRWLSVFLRVFILIAISLVVSMVPLVGPFLNILFIPFSLVFMYLLYEDLKSVKPDMSFQPSGRAKIGFVATGIAGFLLLPMLMVALMGSMLLLPLTMLMGQLRGSTPTEVNYPGFVEWDQGVQAAINNSTSGGRIIKRAKIISPKEKQKNTDVKVVEGKAKDWKERLKTVEEVAQSKDKKVVTELISVLKKDNSWQVRKEAALWLGNIGDTQAVGPLTNALESDSSAIVRSYAVRSLGKLEDKRAIDPLRRAYEEQGGMTYYSDKDKKTRSIAEDALEALVSFGVAGKPVKNNKNAKIILADLSDKTQRDVKKILKKVTANKKSSRHYEMPMLLPGGMDKTDAYVQILEDNDRQWFERSEAARILGQSGKKMDVNPLLNELEVGTDLFVRREAVIALGKLGDKRAVTPLTKIRNTEEDEWVRLFAKEALQRLQKKTKGHYKPWVINLASYISMDEAEFDAKKLIAAGYAPYITMFDLNGISWHRLRVGFYSTGKDATISAKELGERFHMASTWVIKPDKKEVMKNR